MDSDLNGFQWTFAVAGDAQYNRLAEAVKALRAAKLSGDWRDAGHWRRVLAGAEVAWGIATLVHCFEVGEFVLLGVRRDDFGTGGLEDVGVDPLDYGYLDFDPFACPYSGDCLGQLIEAFGHRVIDSGPA